MRVFRPGVYSLEIQVSRSSGDTALAMHTEIMEHASAMRHPKAIRTEAILAFKHRIPTDPALESLRHRTVYINAILLN